MSVEWEDEGIVLAVRPQGESAALVTALTFEHGRHAGWVQGGTGRRRGPVFQPTNRLRLRWTARLDQHLGRFEAEPVELYAGRLFEHREQLATALAASALLETLLPEREPHPALYAQCIRLFERLAQGEPARLIYLQLELLLLAELGFALDLSSCALSGRTTELAFVSPRTGRAVARGVAPSYEDRLLPLPAFIAEEREPEDAASFDAGLRLTAWFLERAALEAVERRLPEARSRFADMIEKEMALGR